MPRQAPGPAEQEQSQADDEEYQKNAHPDAQEIAFLEQVQGKQHAG
jgi:hypothetical protein